MRCHSAFACAAALAWPARVAFSAPTAAPEAAPGQGVVSIASAGRPTAIVVLAENPTRPAQVAAKELVHYVRKMTGVKLPVVVDAMAPARRRTRYRVLIGESSLTRGYGLENADFAPQEYLIQTRGRDLIFMGRDAEEHGVITYEKSAGQSCAPRRQAPWGRSPWYAPGMLPHAKVGGDAMQCMGTQRRDRRRRRPRTRTSCSELLDAARSGYSRNTTGTRRRRDLDTAMTELGARAPTKAHLPRYAQSSMSADGEEESET